FRWVLRRLVRLNLIASARLFISLPEPLRFHWLALSFISILYLLQIPLSKNFLKNSVLARSSIFAALKIHLTRMVGSTRMPLRVSLTDTASPQIAAETFCAL